MKTQISKDSYNPDRRCSGVYHQQGRMITDADWNESVDLLRGALAAALQDVIGSGSPRLGAVRINNDRTIEPGDLYVEGRRAELPGSGPMPASAQPDLPGCPDFPAAGPYLVYADIWDRTVTSLEDAGLRDAGLYGADTCTRTQTMVQIKTCPVATNPETGIPAHGNALLSLELHTSLEARDPCDPCADLLGVGAGRAGNYLFRLEVHRVEGPANNPTRLVLKWSSENGAEQGAALSQGKMPPGFINSSYLYEFFNLTTEKHPGVHLTQGFSPVAGILNTVYEIPEGDADPKDFVRRWDGYCELTRAGAKWSLEKGWDRGVALSTAVADTAPGYVSLGPVLRINLQAMLLTLELTGRSFMAGDFWLAPVREAIHGPGSEIVNGASPAGITHHYLQLARVAADGSVQRYEDDADRRQHNFPPLTDLQAQDVGYKTDCASGLFDATHDNVKKALDRLCELAAEHIHYTADCKQGLFQNFVGTVKQALDKICTIQAQDINFSKPCDTSIFKGQIVTNLAQALQLLCDIQAGQVSYQPGPGCTFLAQPGITTVQDALDALCQRPSGGCKVTVGNDGIFPTLEAALKTLIEQKIYDICICLLTGPHDFGGAWQPLEGQDHFNLSITGCGPGTKIVLTAPLRFRNLNSLYLDNFTLEGSWDNEFPLVVDNCTELVISELHQVGLALERPLLLISGGNRVRLEKNILEAYQSVGFDRPQKVFEFYPPLVKLFTLPQRDQFFEAAAEVAENLAKLSPQDRKVIASHIDHNIETMEIGLTLEEKVAYSHLTSALGGVTAAFAAVLAELREVRDQTHHVVAGRGVVFRDALADLALGCNTVFGTASFYGFPEGELTVEEMVKMGGLLKDNFRLRGLGTTVQVWNNLFSGFAIGGQMTQGLRELLENKRTVISGIYRSMLFKSNIIARDYNPLLSENLTLADNNFETLQSIVAGVISQTAIFSGNSVRRTIYDGQTVGGGRVLVAAGEMAKAANLPDASW
ncbi:MAG: hypothetical protein ACOZFS_04885 [Thermodesulfobacteriota bacterium]